MKNIISIQDFEKSDILTILEKSALLKKRPPEKILEGKILASCFFEPSTRTQFSFHAAMKKMGGDVIGFSDSQTTSLKKGESFYDMMKIIGSYSDVIVIRHPERGSAQIAAEASLKPVINAGDGDNEHPTQTFLDLLTIFETQKKLDDLNIMIMGDLKYGRTAHSLALALRHFSNRLFFVSPQNLAMPDHILAKLSHFSCHEDYREVIDVIDVLYMTRLQEERVSSTAEKNGYGITLENLARAKSNLKILHPLPRREELPVAIDQSEFAHYFPQAENGLYVRMALLKELLC